MGENICLSHIWWGINLYNSIAEEKKTLITNFKWPMNREALVGYSPLGHQESDMT